MYTLTLPFFSVNDSVIVVIVLWDKDVMLLQESSKVLADQSSHIQERHHHYCHTDKTKRCLENIKRNCQVA